MTGAFEAVYEALALGGEDLRDWTLCREPAFAQQCDFSAGGEGVGGVVGGQDRLYAVLTKPVLQAVEEGIAGGSIERRKGLVEQQQVRPGA